MRTSKTKLELILLFNQEFWFLERQEFMIVLESVEFNYLEINSYFILKSTHLSNIKLDNQ
jgi:hypothetical protein